MYSLLFFAMTLTADLSLPPPANSNLQPVTVDELTWSGDLASALEQAAKDKKLIFIDFTGQTCLNCKLNEKNVFVKSEVKELFKQYVRVQLYADTVPEAFYKKPPDEEKRESDAETNLKFQKEMFKTEQLPLYAIVAPAEAGRVKVVSVYDEGRINKIDKFVEFLKKPLSSP